jgi:hypothetical protein
MLPFMAPVIGFSKNCRAFINKTTAANGMLPHTKERSQMNNKSEIDHIALAVMMRKLIKAGRETGLIMPSYLKIMETTIPQMQKIHERQQVRAANAAKREAKATK